MNITTSKKTAVLDALEVEAIQVHLNAGVALVGALHMISEDDATYGAYCFLRDWNEKLKALVEESIRATSVDKKDEVAT